MRTVAIRVIARGKSPTVGTITLELTGVRNTMRVVDTHVVEVLLPVVGVPVLQPARIEPAERVVSKEQRPAVRHPQRQRNVVVRAAVQKIAPRSEPTVIDERVDGIARRPSRQDVGNETLVPAVDLVIHRPTVVGTPVPVEELAPTLRVPIELRLFPQARNAPTDLALLRRVAVEILPRAQQAHQQKGGLDEVGAVVLAPEGNRGGRMAVDEVREDAVITRRP